MSISSEERWAWVIVVLLFVVCLGAYVTGIRRCAAKGQIFISREWACVPGSRP